MTSATTVTGVYPAVRRKSGSFKSITDTVTPNFRERVKNGEVILNNVTLVRDTRACTESSWRAGNHPTWGTRTFEGSIACEHHVTLATPSGYATDVTNASANVLIEAYAKMNAVDVQSLVSVAELGKTLEMLHHPLAKANDLVNKMIILKKAKFENPRYNLLKAYLKRYPTRTAKEVGDAITSAYLEYRYGLKPLMYDVAGIVKNVTTARPSPKTLYVARAGLSLSKRVTAPNTYLGIPGTTDSRGDCEKFLTNRISAGVFYNVADKSAADYQKRSLGFDLRSVPIAAYELLPYSFVLDWFLQLGPWLQAVLPNPALVVRGNWVTNHEIMANTTDNVRADLYVSTYPATTYKLGGGSYSEVIETTTRSVNQSLPTLPPLQAKSLSGLHQLDSLGLLYQKFARNVGAFRTLRI
jgi:hypothetical protein